MATYRNRTTAVELIPAVGKQVLVDFESIQVLCLVTNAKSAWGDIRVEVQPLMGGTSKQWVSLGRVSGTAGLTIDRDRAAECLELMMN